tara:strand:+ start:646 stop:3537 length:2892 start_codon:yes stop_codon:yes gene_type:complete
MNLQLILYPQNYDGYATNFGGPVSTEFIIDGEDFNTLNASPLLAYTDIIGNPSPEDLMDASTGGTFPTIPNAWYRWHSSSPGSAANPFAEAPTASSGEVTLNSDFTSPAVIAGQSGMYQRLQGLIIGETYTITAKFDTPTYFPDFECILKLLAFDNLTQIGGGQTIINTTQGTPPTVTKTFTATAHDNTIMLMYENIMGTDTRDALLSLSVRGSGQPPSGAINVYGDGQVICDLYEDEEMPLTLSVDDFKNAAEKVQSYSKAFKLPATKRNNQIFDNIYEVTRTIHGHTGFNPLAKTRAVLKEDGLIVFDGFMRMLDVVDKKGEISYEVNLYSEVVALADLLKEKTFNDIDFKELAHVYNFDAIEKSWNDSGTAFPYTNASTSGFRSDFDTIKYPFVNWTSQILISDGSSGTAGNPQLQYTEQVFRPWLQIKYLIDRIFADTEFTYESDFFNDTAFKRLYMDFNWGADNFGASIAVNGTLKHRDSQTSYVDITGLSPSDPTVLRFDQYVSGLLTAYWDNTNYRFISAVNNLTVECEFRIRIENHSALPATPYSNHVRVSKYNSGGQWLETLDENSDSINSYLPSTGNPKDWSGTVSTQLNVGEYIQAESWSSSASGASNIRMASGTKSYLSFTASNTSTQADQLLNKLRGDVNQWDFLKGLFNMFNLVSIPVENNPKSIKIEPWNEFFKAKELNSAVLAIDFEERGIQHDWTPKIDISEIKLSPLADLNEFTIFKYEEDDGDWAFENYRNNSANFKLYGSQKFDGKMIATNGANSVLEGTEEIIASPFAATVPAPLLPQWGDIIVPHIYSYNPDEGTSEGFDNLPRICYNDGVKSTINGYYIPTQNGSSAVSAQDEYLQFSHLSSVPTNTSTVDYNFGACQLYNPIGLPPTINLFSVFWLPYFSELYNPDTRVMTLKVDLNPADIQTFSFSDRVFIKNREYRVNKIDYKPGQLSTVEFILIPY